MNTTIASSAIANGNDPSAGPAKSRTATILQRGLLACGVLSSLFYAAMNIICAVRYEGYDAVTQTVSELSAIDTPTRPLWLALLVVYTFLGMAFGWGVIRSAGSERKLRLAGILLIVYVIICMFWPPMHQRQVLAAGGRMLTDVLHIAFAAVTIPLMLLIIGCSAAALGKGFRIYSVVTVGVLLGFGILTGRESPQMEANLPTPMLGVWERICIGDFMVWIVVLAVVLLRADSRVRPAKTPAP